MKRPTMTPILLTLLLPLTLWAQITTVRQTRPTVIPSSYHYAVKVVCGSDKGYILSKGSYKTAINIYNPNDTTVVFSKHLVPAPPGETGPTYEINPYTSIGAGLALEIDCAELFEVAYDYLKQKETTLLKGFVILESKFPLNVVAVYTSEPLSRWCGGTSSIDVETVYPTRR